ncbi:hypothetical protein LY78DRAFT_490668 [Colletotrichum sublineola]|uniref:Putative pfs domain-containing protein n=1 Tax=Colletotrichum sublineola TaxID=1173701 RepID=A0A066XDA2_COLSU|nr:hypothetical protein LY78DRAFT_490668 [Colletotrichum sublineola]KDN63691.1 putative pfs domain-containing protein [Colletotrichum sublineola]
MGSVCHRFLISPLLWKTLTFCRPSARFIDPSFVRKRLGAFLEVRRRDRAFLNNDSYIEDLCANQHIEQWTTSDRLSNVFLEASFTTAPCAHQSLLESVDQLTKHYAMVCTLGGLPTSAADGLLSDSIPESFLEQLTVQALRCVTLHKPLPFVLDNLLSFKKAKDCDDRFALLRKTCEKIPCVDVSMIPIHSQDATKSWPTRF